MKTRTSRSSERRQWLETLPHYGSLTAILHPRRADHPPWLPAQTVAGETTPLFSLASPWDGSGITSSSLLLLLFCVLIRSGTESEWQKFRRRGNAILGFALLCVAGYCRAGESESGTLEIANLLHRALLIYYIGNPEFGTLESPNLLHWGLRISWNNSSEYHGINIPNLTEFSRFAPPLKSAAN